MASKLYGFCKHYGDALELFQLAEDHGNDPDRLCTGVQGAGSQVHDLQRAALVAAGFGPDNI
jgi:hypothetical protein